MHVEPWELISRRQDRLEDRIEEVEEKAEGIPELRKSVDRLTNAVYTFCVLVLIGFVSYIFFGPGT